MKIRCALVLVTLFLPLQSNIVASDKLPEKWCGSWSGKLTVHAPDGTTFDREMKLSIKPLQDSKSYEWRMDSEFRGKTSMRDYLLVPDEARKGEFTIDEQNGILLNAHLKGDTLYMYYLDGDILITGRYELRENGIFMELSSVETSDPRVSSPEGGEFQIKAYRLGAVQAGLLKKVAKGE